MLLSLFEDRQEKIELSSFPQSDLLKLQNFLGEANLSIQTNGTVRAHRYVGALSSGITNLQVLPKVFSKASTVAEVERDRASQLLFKMLKHTGIEDISIDTEEQLATFGGDILELIINLFLKRLYRELLFNSSKEFESNEQVTSFVRGKILHQESIRVSRGLAFPLVVQQDEFTIDNVLNRVLKGITLLLRDHSRNQKNLALVRKVLFSLDHVSDIPLTKATFDRIDFHRRNENFRTIVNMARQFFLGRQPSFYGGRIDSLGFLVPLYEVFELYVFKQFSIAMYPLGYAVGHANPTRDLIANRHGRTLQTLRPDIVVKRHGNVVLILDAKYKDPYDGGQIKPETADMYQLATYAAVFGCDSVGLVYPDFDNRGLGTRILETYRFRFADKEISFAMIAADIINASPDKCGRDLAEIAIQLDN